MLGLLIGGIAATTIASAISGYMGAEAQADAYDKLARATDEERRAFQAAYDQAFGAGSYNSKMQELGVQAGQTYYDKLNDQDAWDRYVNGERAYTAPQDFSFTAEDLYSDPSYEFRRKQGQDGLKQYYASQGLSMSGPAMKAAMEYDSNLASQEYANAYNRAFQRYTDDRNFDYNAWKSESQQYYQNLLNQLNGINTVAQRGADANVAQAQGLSALAGQQAAAAQQKATAQGAAGMAEASGASSILDALTKGMTMGLGVAASQAGATPTQATSPSNTYTISGNMGNSGSQDFSELFLNGWNPATNTGVITTQNILGS